MTEMERNGEGIRKICLYCGQLLDDAAVECTRCHNRVNDKVFDELSEEDTRTIKSEGLTLRTPSSIAAQITDSAEKDTASILEKDQSILRAYELKEEEQFSLLVFGSFCYFYTMCSSVRMKQGSANLLTTQLREALLHAVIELFCKQATRTPTAEILLGRAKMLYQKLETLLRVTVTETNIPSKLKLANALAAAVFVHDKPSLIRGLTLYDHFSLTQDKGDEFKKYFLVEDKDLD